MRKVKVRVIKAWGVVNIDGVLEPQSVSVDKESAGNFCYKWDGDIVVPCTISYALPKKAKGRKV